MRKRIAIPLVLTGVLVLLPLVLIAVLIYTPIGTNLVAAQLHRLERFGVKIEGLTGTIAGPLRVARFELTHPRVHIVSNDLVADIEVSRLLFQTIRVNSVTA